MIELGANRYGKAAIRVVRVARSPNGDQVRDLTVAIALEGAFEAAHTDGDNSAVIATDTMKNTAYAFAKDHLDGSIEVYGQALAEHFLEAPQVDAATVNVRSHHWSAIAVAGSPAPDAFVRGGEGTRVATVNVSLGGSMVEAGVEDLTVMKTTRSGFSGFPRDRYTTLVETEDRLMATKVTAIWRYGAPGLDYDATFDAIRATLLEVFADHESGSVQESIWIMARSILERHEEIAQIRMALPNLHHWLVDLSPFGLENDREIYTPTTEPHGIIEATVRRGES
ncbi:MAG: urate oxidase [Thermomicrobiales bacterium]|jgi:urate oxidase|nr:MAG: urate oxidase [Thermomicrobiales bacterium]